MGPETGRKITTIFKMSNKNYHFLKIQSIIFHNVLLTKLFELLFAKQ
jgi:hypothetical protein